MVLGAMISKGSLFFSVCIFSFFLAFLKLYTRPLQPRSHHFTSKDRVRGGRITREALVESFLYAASPRPSELNFLMLAGCSRCEKNSAHIDNDIFSCVVSCPSS
jgi:hypothetical protein